jgi:two-component system heavy metal sensor histidine kinase CusS
MRSIGARLTLLYAAAATASAAVLFVSGYVMLNQRLVHGLDALNAAEFEQLKVRLGPDHRHLTPRIIDERIRETADAGSALFFINVDEPKSGMVFYSRNLNHRSIPDVKGHHIYNAELPGIGEIRVQEFVMAPFDVTIATPMAQVRSSMRSYIAVSAGLLLTMLFASAAIGLGLSNMVLRPLKQIRETAKRISSDNLSERIPVPAHEDELTDLAQLLNRMFGRLENSFDQVKRFAAEASHELKTPLSLIRLHGEKLLEDETLSPQSVDAIVVQLEEVARLNRTIEEMLFLSRIEANAVSLDLRPGDPAQLLANFEQDAQALAEHHSCRFRLDASGAGMVAFEGRWLRQVWLNLLANAFAVTPAGGLVTMTSAIGHGRWTLVVEDEGPGLREENLHRIFDRFVQLGPAEQRSGGSGLGLAISRGIVALHAGTIAATNRPDRSGLRVTVTIPTA